MCDQVSEKPAYLFLLERITQECDAIVRVMGDDAEPEERVGRLQQHKTVLSVLCGCFPKALPASENLRSALAIGMQCNALKLLQVQRVDDTMGILFQIIGILRINR